VTVVSYSQNLEDVLLHRVFAEVVGGTYVDIGAAHPDVHSVTKLFYDLGWSGVNVEPQEAYFELLQFSRPRDLNLKLAVAENSGEKEFFTVVGFEELSSLKTEVASSMRQLGKVVNVSSVPTASLKEILEQAGMQEVHFLKVDVEGGENEVIAGGDFLTFRPWVIVVEVVAGGVVEPDLSWITRLATAGYREVYFDGLNKFFLAAERSSLADRFDVPVNVLDDYIVDYGLAATTKVRAIGEAVGADRPDDGREVTERVVALFSDRAQLQSTTTALLAQLEEFRKIGVIVDAQNSHDGLEVGERVAALLADRSSLQSGAEVLRTELVSVRLEAMEHQQQSETLWQASWERERFVVSLVSDLHELRELQSQLSKELELAAADGNAAKIDAQNRLNAVYRSSSWRLTLGLRALRHPQRYFAALRGK
jgi:FkbM family methyltransferase